MWNDWFLLDLEIQSEANVIFWLHQSIIQSITVNQCVYSVFTLFIRTNKLNNVHILAIIVSANI